MRHRFLALVGLLAVAAGAGASSAAASHSWGNYHWARTANPFVLKVGDNVTSTWDSHLATASGDWSKSTVLDTTLVAGLAKGKNCRPPNGRVEVCNAAYGNNGWLGLAQIWISSSHIVQGLVKLNDTYFNTPTYNAPEKRQHVMCQEVGHTLGLDHQDESGADLNTCMDYARSLDNQHPNAHDYEQLQIIYSHTDGSNSVASFPAQAAAHVTWLTPSHSVEHFGAGFELHTFIVWESRR
jgi:hypothetical protein